MSSETRMIRPYEGVEPFQDVLDACALYVGERRIVGGSRVSLSPDEYLNDLVRLVLARDENELAQSQSLVAEGLGDLSLTTSDVEFVVLASAPRLKMVDVVVATPLDELPELPRIIPIAERPRALKAPVGGCDVRVFFCLAHELQPRPLRPFRKGTWLGKQEYDLRTELGGVGFTPMRLDDAERERLGLDRDTTRYASIDADQSVFDLDPPSDAVKLYIDADLLDRLAIAAHSSLGKQMQRQMFLDAASAIAMKTIAEVSADGGYPHADIDEFAGSLVHGLVVMLAGRAQDDEGSRRRNQQYKLLVGEPARFLSNLEAKLARRRDVMSIFEE